MLRAPDCARNRVTSSAPPEPAENTWWWTVMGLVIALGVMLPLMALLVTVAMKGGKGREGSK